MKSNFYRADQSLNVNLDHVSSISFDEKNSRIIFNLDYSVQLDIIDNNRHYKKTISDYIYWNTNDFIESADNLISYLSAPEFKFFINKPSDNKAYPTIINLNKVSSIKFDRERLRIIFNMANSISFKDKNDNYKLTGEFIYCDFDDSDSYDKAVSSLK